ncbi:hypothetical protein GQ54DRAFT_14309 [Martensiomyces pterosporus]|nr:hypothetical protein GQ54DRAFT_14309 [Martensiomyces pterosporus]
MLQMALVRSQQRASQVRINSQISRLAYGGDRIFAFGRHISTTAVSTGVARRSFHASEECRLPTHPVTATSKGSLTVGELKVNAPLKSDGTAVRLPDVAARRMHSERLNPWVYVLPMLEYPEIKRGLSGSELLRLLHRLQKIHRGQIESGWSGAFAWLASLQRTRAMAGTHGALQTAETNDRVRLDSDLLTEAQKVDCELALTHIKVLEIRGELARGLHTGSTRGGYERSLRWSKSGELRDTRVALVGKAFNAKCPGLLLNLLLDWNTGAQLISTTFLDRICAEHLGSTRQLEESISVSKLLYDHILGSANEVAVSAARAKSKRGTTTRFVDVLWQMDNIEHGIAALRRLIDSANTSRGPSPPDSLISSLAIQLMQCCSRFNRMPKAHEIFDMCLPVLRQNPAAYNILMYPEAMAFNMHGVVSILRTMQRHGAVPDPVMWTTIMTGMCKSGRIEGAMKLFAMHLEFLPRRSIVATGSARSNPDRLEPDSTEAVPAVDNGQQSLRDRSAKGAISRSSSSGEGGQGTDTRLFAPLPGFHGLSSNLWEEWYANSSKRYAIDPYIALLIRELANRYHDSKSPTARGAAKAGGGVQASKEAAVTPWLPTLATHKILLKYLSQHGMTNVLAKYFQLLKRVWPQYSQWAAVCQNSANPSESSGLRGIERIVHGHMAQHMPELRKVYGLYPVSGASSNSRPSEDRSPGYYTYCEDIISLAKRSSIEGSTPLLQAPVGLRPERVVYNKSLHAYALGGDMRTILHHMQRYPKLSDIATWTELVRCICTQVAEDPRDEMLVHPRRFAALVETKDGDSKNDQQSWIDFILELATVLSSRGIDFTQVTFGIVIQLAVQLNSLEGVAKVVEFMRDNSTVRFSVDMLKMVLRVDCSFELKCLLVRDALDIPDMTAGSSSLGSEPGLVRALAQPTVRPDHGLLSLLVKSADKPDALLMLRELVGVFSDRYGIRPLAMHYESLLDTCKQLGMDGEARFWIDHLVASGTPITARLAEYMATQRI